MIYVTKLFQKDTQIYTKQNKLGFEFLNGHFCRLDSQ